VVRAAWCVVRGAWCVVRGAWCVVRAAWCVVRGAWCVVRAAWCVVREAVHAMPAHLEHGLERALGTVKNACIPRGAGPRIKTDLSKILMGSTPSINFIELWRAGTGSRGGRPRAPQTSIWGSKRPDLKNARRDNRDKDTISPHLVLTPVFEMCSRTLRNLAF